MFMAVICWILLMMAFIFGIGLLEYLWELKRRRESARPYVIGVDLAKGKDSSVSFKAAKLRAGDDTITVITSADEPNGR